MNLEKYGLLVLLGLAWSLRLSAIKYAAEGGLDPFVIVQVAVIGILVVFSVISTVRGRPPSTHPIAIRFYVLSGLLGFIIPFFLESVVSSHIPVFLLIVIISSVPIFTAIIAGTVGLERVTPRVATGIVAGFFSALAIAYDTVAGPDMMASPWIWVGLAFLVPILYAIYTVFIVSKWPAGIDAVQVVNGQALMIVIAICVALPFSGLIGQLGDAVAYSGSLTAIVVCEAAALLLYLRIAKRFGAIFVSQANYMSMFFGAVIGFFLFGERLGVLALAAAVLLIGSLVLTRKPQA